MTLDVAHFNHNIDHIHQNVDPSTIISTITRLWVRMRWPLCWLQGTVWKLEAEWLETTARTAQWTQLTMAPLTIMWMVTRMRGRMMRGSLDLMRMATQHQAPPLDPSLSWTHNFAHSQYTGENGWLDGHREKKGTFSKFNNILKLIYSDIFLDWSLLCILVHPKYCLQSIVHIFSTTQKLNDFCVIKTEQSCVSQV